MSIHPVNRLQQNGQSDRQAGLSLHDRLGLISLIEEGVRLRSSDSPIVADLFAELWKLVENTVSGSKIDRLKPEKSTKGFKIFEINAETGENLGRLNMLYLKKPIPCYYLVYVEVAHPFRKKGLGNRILKEFKKFLIEKNTVGVLDNIIPRDDPTFDIYLKLDWKPVEAITGVEPVNGAGVYMVYVPPAFAGKDLTIPLRQLLFHLRRKRPAIDMRDNELMVRRTIEEFKELYDALVAYFHDQLTGGDTRALIRFMFTRFVTKLLGFRRRIGDLLGYTGGESLEQIVLHPAVRDLPVQSYAPKELAANPCFVSGNKELWLKLPEMVKKHPARMIEALPNYRRPSLVSWMEAKGKWSSDTLTLGDLMDLGFDPTRLKEITIEGEDYIFERIQPRLLPEHQGKKRILEGLETDLAGERVRHAVLKANPILLIIGDRGNCYVLRKKVAGIHWDEAVEELQSSPELKGLNASLRLDKIIIATVRKANERIRSRIGAEQGAMVDRFSWFVSWNLETNQPKLAVDFAGSYFETIWIA